MSWLSIPLTFAPGLQDLVTADLDGDGQVELIAVSASPNQKDPKPLSLQVYSLQDGALQKGERYSLDTRARLWDAEGGIWAMEAGGLRRLDGGDSILSKPLALAGVGPSTSSRVDITWDLDQDGAPELLYYSQGRLGAVGVDGADWLSVPLSMEGGLSSRGQEGGQSWNWSNRLKPFTLDDFDGDGWLDLLFPDRSSLRVEITSYEGLGGKQLTVPLPLDLDPPEIRGSRSGKKEISQVWFRDIDNDGLTDLLVTQWVFGKSFLGATAEVLFARGNGSSFGTAQVLKTEEAAFGMQLQDLDGDGDQDLLTPLVDIGISAIGRALVAREAKVKVSWLEMKDGRYQAPQRLHELGWPIERPEEFQAPMEGDLNGDGWLDLVVLDEGLLTVYLQAGGGPSAELSVPGLKAPRLMVRDLDGDGRSELLVWDREGPSAMLFDGS